MLKNNSQSVSNVTIISAFVIMSLMVIGVTFVENSIVRAQEPTHEERQQMLEEWSHSIEQWNMEQRQSEAEAMETESDVEASTGAEQLPETSIIR